MTSLVFYLFFAVIEPLPYGEEKKIQQIIINFADLQNRYLFRATRRLDVGTGNLFFCLCLPATTSANERNAEGHGTDSSIAERRGSMWGKAAGLRLGAREAVRGVVESALRDAARLAAPDFCETI